jgi:hypothetical protein
VCLIGLRTFLFPYLHVDLIRQFLEVEMEVAATKRIARYVPILDGQTVLFIFEICRVQEYCNVERCMNKVSE